LLSFALLLVGLLASEFPGPRPDAAVRPHRFPVRFTIADFDGDQKPDLATVNASLSTSRLTLYSIHLQLSVGPEAVIGITAPMGGLQIFSSDVNGDRNLDLVVRTSLESNLVAVLLNDGHGKFTVVEPGAFPGLQKQAQFYAGAQALHWIESVSLLPPRGTIGEEAGSFPRSRLQTAAESMAAWNVENFHSFLVQSSFGRSPPKRPSVS
jgi:hypothetical protein